MYDNFSTREYALIDAYLANTLQPNERAELNKALQTNKSLYEYIVLRKQLQYIGDQKQLVNAALLVQTDLDTPLYEDMSAPKPKFWLQKSFYAVGAAASLLLCVCFLIFYAQNNTNHNINNTAKYTNNIKDGVNNIKDGVNNIKDDANNIKDASNNIKDGANNIKDDVNNIKDGVNNIKDGANNIKDDVNNIKDGVNNINNTANNIQNTINKDNNTANNIQNTINKDNNAANVKTVETIKAAESNLSTYFKKHFPNEMNGSVFSFDTTNDTLFTTQRGTVIAIAKNVFATNDKNLSITVKEAYTYKDMFLHQLNTFADNSELMETGGMLFLEVKDSKGQKLALKPNQKIRVQMPSNSLKTDMQLFNQNETDTAGVRNASAWSVASASNITASFNNITQNNDDLIRNARINKIAELAETVKSIRTGFWGNFEDNDCATCYKKRFKPLNPFYFAKDKHKNTKNLNNAYLENYTCQKYWNMPIIMNKHLNILKKKYKTKDLDIIIKKEIQVRKAEFKQKALVEFNAYKRVFGFKDSTEFVKAIDAVSNPSMIETNQDKNEYSVYFKFLMVFYKVGNEKDLYNKLRWENLHRDSIDITDMMRFYQTKTSTQAKRINSEQQQRILKTYKNPISTWHIFGWRKNISQEELNKQKKQRFNEDKQRFNPKWESDFTYFTPYVIFAPHQKQEESRISEAQNAVNIAIGDVGTLGWINMDRFMGQPNLIALKPENPENATIIAVFKNYKCCLGISDNMNPYASSKGAPRVPRNQPIILVAYKMKDGELMLSATHTTTSKATEILPLKPILPVELDKMIAGL